MIDEKVKEYLDRIVEIFKEDSCTSIDELKKAEQIFKEIEKPERYLVSPFTYKMLCEKLPYLKSQLQISELACDDMMIPLSQFNYQKVVQQNPISIREGA